MDEINFKYIEKYMVSENNFKYEYAYSTIHIRKYGSSAYFKLQLDDLKCELNPLAPNAIPI